MSLPDWIIAAASIIGLINKPDSGADDKNKASGNTYIENQHNHYYPEAHGAQGSSSDESREKSTQPSTPSQHPSPKPWSWQTRVGVTGVFSMLVLFMPFSQCVNLLNSSISSTGRIDYPSYNNADRGKSELLRDFRNKHPELNADDVYGYCTSDAARYGIVVIPLSFFTASFLESRIKKKSNSRRRT